MGLFGAKAFNPLEALASNHSKYPPYLEPPVRTGFVGSKFTADPIAPSSANWLFVFVPFTFNSTLRWSSKNDGLRFIAPENLFSSPVFKIPSWLR